MIQNCVAAMVCFRGHDWWDAGVFLFGVEEGLALDRLESSLKFRGGEGGEDASE